MQIATIAGNLGRDAEIKNTQGGDKLCSFSVAVTTGWGDRKGTTWWDVTVWGKRGEALVQHLRKGSKVSVIGEVSTREHDGKTYLQLRADHVALQGGGEQRGQERGSGSAAQTSRGQSYASDRDLDDDVPF